MATSQSDCQLVTGVLKTLGGLSEDAISMLVASLPHALGEGEQKAENRHGFQAEVLAMIAEAFTLGSKHADETKDGQVQKAEELRAGVSTCKENAVAAVAGEAAAKEAFAGKEAAYAELLKEAAGVEKLHKEAEATQKVSDAARDAALQARESAQAVQECTLSMLVSGGCEDKATFEDAMETVMKLLNECEVEACLIAGAAAAFSVKPDARGAFDKVIVDGVQGAVSKKFEELSEVASKRVEEARELRAETLGLWAMLEEVQEAVQTAKAEKSEAEKALKESSKARVEAEKSIGAQEELVLLCEVEQEAQAKKLVEIAKAVEALDRLQTGDYAPAVAPAAAAAPEAMEVDAEAPKPMEVEGEAAVAPAPEAAAPAPEAAADESMPSAPVTNKAESLTTEATAVLEAAPSMGA